MPIELTTGTPGAGKTLYTVSMRLKALADSGGRRLMIGGIPDLLLPHEVVHVPVVNADQYVERWADVIRQPGDQPVEWVRRHVPEGGKSGDWVWVACEPPPDGKATRDIQRVPVSVDTWWLWCHPGDVLVVDECQRVFRPMASGRRVPEFIAKLETHRHYGVDFVLVTQHPQLLHSNVRALVGQHRHVRKLFGSSARMVYEWDRCSAVDRTKDATSSTWRGAKWAYGLYKSSELHTKQRFSIPAPLFLVAFIALALPVALWYAYSRVSAMTDPNRLASAAAASAPSSSASAIPDINFSAVQAAAASQALAALAEPSTAPAAGEPASTATVTGEGIESGPVGCIASDKLCRCFSGGKLVDEKPDRCRQVIGVAGAVLPLDSVPIASATWREDAFPSPELAPAVPHVRSTIDHPSGYKPQDGRP